MSTTNKASFATRPNCPTERALHSNDELQTRPSASGTHGQQRGVGHANRRSETANSVLRNAGPEVQGNDSGNFRLGGAGLAEWPICNEVDGTFALDASHVANAMSVGGGYSSNRPIEELIELYVPRDTTYWKEVRPLVLEATRATNPRSWDRTREVMLVVTRFIIWAWKIGARELDLDDILTANAIRRFIAAQTQLSVSARARHETHLARVTEARTGKNPGNKSHVNTNAAPYTGAEVASILSVANSYSTERMRVGCATIIALGIGAGLRMTEMATLRNEDLELPRLHITGKYARDAVLLPEWRNSVQPSGPSDDYLLLPGVKRPDDRGRVIKNFLHSLPGAPVSPQRLRATWTIDLLVRGISVQDFLALTAHDTARTMDRYFEYLPAAATPEDIIARLYEGSNV